MRKDVYGKFYNPNKILSYNRPLNFSVGSRSIGKSTGWAMFCILDFVNNAHGFIYCRRTGEELKKTCAHYFDNAISILNGYGYNVELVYDGEQYFINGTLAGFAIPLSMQQKYKSANFSFVHNILYDEFMIMTGDKNGYLGNKSTPLAEVDAMASLYQTVDRGIDRAFRNETRIIFIGNAGTFYNPFFIAYGIDRYLQPDTKYLAPKGQLYVVECTDTVEATKDIKNSYAFKISTESTQNYAYENTFNDNANTYFVENIKEPQRPIFNMQFRGEIYGVVELMKSGFILITDKKVEGITLAMTNADHRPNYIMIERLTAMPYTQLLLRAYQMGYIRFKNHKCKFMLDTLLMYK